MKLVDIAAKYYGDSLVTRKIVQSIFKDMKEIVLQSVLPQVRCFLDHNNEHHLNRIEQSILVDFQTFTSQFKTFNLFKSMNTFIEPLPFTVGVRKDFQFRQGVRVFGNVPCYAHYIPLKEMCYNFFSMGNVLTSTLSFMNELTQVPFLETQDRMINFIQGSVWQNRMRGKSNRIPLCLFTDDWESGNSLGSRAGVHKLCSVYCAFPTLTVHHTWGRSVSQSSLDKIILVALFHSSDRAEFGNDIILKPIIDDLNDLSTNGLFFDTEGFKGRVFFELGLVLGDNLGIHQLCGLVESFSANRCCRYCRM